MDELRTSSDGRDNQLHRFPVVDALRGLAAMSVVLFHGIDYIPELLTRVPQPISRALNLGQYGVAAFFVISGFVISHSLYDRRITLGVFKRFTIRRSLRLDPPYWLAIAGFIAYAIYIDGKPITDYSVTQVLAHMFYMQDLLSKPAVSIVFWTLCLEVQFYIAYAALLLVGQNRPAEPFQGRQTALLLCAATLVSLLWPLGLGPEMPRGLFPPLWHGFLVGVWAYWASREPRGAPVLFLYSAAIIAGSFLAGKPGFSTVCAVTALFLYAASMSRYLYSGLNWRWLQLLGLVSYSLYLTHVPATNAAFRFGNYFFGRSVNTEALLWPFSIVFCVCLSAVLWWLIERPSIALARKISLSATKH